jgi:hypothetical protein
MHLYACFTPSLTAQQPQQQQQQQQQQQLTDNSAPDSQINDSSSNSHSNNTDNYSNGQYSNANVSNGSLPPRHPAGSMSVNSNPLSGSSSAASTPGMQRTRSADYHMTAGNSNSERGGSMTSSGLPNR